MSTGFVLNIPQEMLNRLEDADKKIEKLAKTSEDAQVRIVSAFRSMTTNGVDAFIQRLDVAQQKLAQLGGTQLNVGINGGTGGIQQLVDAINKLSQASKTNITINGLGTVGNQTQTAIDAINKLMATLQQLQQMGGQQFLGGVNNLGRQTLREMNKEARKMQKTMQDLDTAIQNYGISATDLANKLQQARQAQQQFNDAAKQQAQADVSGLIGMKGQQTTLNELKNYANELKRTMANLDPKSQEWKRLNDIYKQTNREIKNIQNSMKDVQKQSRSLMDISGQLARRLALVFSVSQITGYVKKLIEVRGEFELQQRSLQAILQNKDEANRIWQQTVDLAVRSPFRVKELVSYTKQLAAYRIESDKLFETNKMLADISAGLGVDMQRLILAFGQVRSAAYLRGTELRQFTEAGIPILEQLAQYFTELEGRAVSVGDVFERVSKRMVSFADVEEIFKRMTSEGGTFYRMQEIQAETLKGMWSNLKDSVDIMVNEIGKGNESTLKNSIALVKQLVDNWRSVKAVIETAGISLMAYFGVDVLRKIGRGIKALYATISAHPLLAIVSVLGLIATAIWRVREAQNALTAAMSEVDNEILGSLEEGIGLYHKLAEAVNDATKSGEERNKALDNLKSRFQDILPDQYLELEYIKQIGDNYKDAEKAMTDYYDAKAQAQKKDRIEGLYTKELDTDTSELISATRDVVSKLGEKGIISGEMQTAMLSGISGIVNKVVEDVKAGKIDANIERIQGAIFSKLEDYAGYEGHLYGKISESPSLGLLNFGEQVSDVTDTLREYLSALEDIQGLPYETYGQKVAGEWLNKEKESLRQISEIYKKLLSLYSKYSKATDEDKVDIAEDISLAMSQVPENLNAYLPLLQESVDKMKGIAEKGAFEFTASMQTLESDFIEGLAGIAQYAEGEIGDVNGDKIAQTLSGNLQEGIKTASDKLDMTPFQNAVVGGARQIAAKFGQDVNIFEKFIPNQKESLSNIRQEVKSQIESYESQILEMQTSLTQGMYVLSEEVLNNTQKSIKSMTDQLPALKAFLAFLGEMEKDKGRKDNTIEERIKVVDQMNAKYKELNKTLSETDALEGAFEAYKDAFATAYGREDVRQMSAEDFAKNVLNFPDEDAVIAWLDNLAKTVKDKEDKFKVQMAKGKFEMDVQVRLKKEDDQQLLDDIQEQFDRYDLSLELKKLNIPPDLAKSLFDVDYLDLEGLKKAVQDRSTEFIGTDMEDEYKKFLEKINDLSRKAQEEEAKEFINFLKKNLDEIKLVQDKGAYNIALADRLFGEGKITAEQYMSSIRQIVEDTNKEVAKVNLDKFKDSATYIKAMGNLAAYSRDELEGMISALQGQVGANAGNMGADEIRAYYEALERLIDQYDKIESPFQKGEINDLIEYLDLQKELNKEKEKEAALEQRKAEINNRLNLLQAQLKSQQERGDVLGAASTQRQIKSAVGELKEVDGELISVTSNISVISEKVANLGDGMVKGLVVAQKVVNEIANIANASTKMFDDIKSAADALGADTESGGWAKAGYAMEMVGGVSSELTSGLSNLASGNFAGALANVVGMVTKLISGFAKIHDQNYQDIIEAQAEAVERLGKAYEKLEVATESAYSIQQLQQYNEELERNVELQIASYKAMIAAEQAKKNTDDEQIAAWNEELEALTQQWEDLKQSLVEGVGGVSDYRSQTREFVDSWVSAFQETGDGLSGLKKNFREFFDNIIAEQAALRVTEKFLEPFYNSLNTALNDLRLSVGESKDLREEADRIMPELSKALELIWNELGGSRGEAEGAGLSTLSKSIQGITSDQAEILSAYWNSVRGYTASIDSKMDLVLANLGAGAEENPMLEQIRMQTGYLRDIKDTLTWAATSEARALYVRLTKDSLPR